MRKLSLIIICLLITSLSKPAEASPAFLFIATVITGGWATVTLEQCKDEGLNAKDCAKKVWTERSDVPITQKLYNQSYND